MNKKLLNNKFKKNKLQSFVLPLLMSSVWDTLRNTISICTLDVPLSFLLICAYNSSKATGGCSTFFVFLRIPSLKKVVSRKRGVFRRKPLTQFAPSMPPSPLQSSIHCSYNCSYIVYIFIVNSNLSALSSVLPTGPIYKTDFRARSYPIFLPFSHSSLLQKISKAFPSLLKYSSVFCTFHLLDLTHLQMSPLHCACSLAFSHRLENRRYEESVVGKKKRERGGLSGVRKGRLEKCQVSLANPI